MNNPWDAEAATDQSSPRLAAINCITCGAALPALGGNRSKSLTCCYCGSVMDRHDDYKLLAQYRDMPRPAGPFEVGMSGKLFGVEHSIIGILGSEMKADGETYGWTSYQLYSPTHGYSWMTWYDGHLTHTRKTRDVPATGGSANQFIRQKEMRFGERNYRQFESYTAHITYIEGEFTWVPKLRDRNWVIEYIDPPYGYAIGTSDSETEYERSTYLDQKETLAAFGVEEGQPRPAGVHALQPFRPGWFHSGLAKAATYLLPLAFLSTIALWIIGGGTMVANHVLQNPAAGGEFVFPITNASQLTELEITAPVTNAWAWYDLELISEATGETIAEFDRGVEYYKGVEDGEAWTEGSQTTTMLFRAEAAGDYRLRVEGIEDGSANVPLTINVKEGVMLSRYPFWMLLFLALCAGSMAFRKWRFEGKRWGAFEED